MAGITAKTVGEIFVARNLHKMVLLRKDSFVVKISLRMRLSPKPICPTDKLLFPKSG